MSFHFCKISGPLTFSVRRLICKKCRESNDVILAQKKEETQYNACRLGITYSVTCPEQDPAELSAGVIVCQTKYTYYPLMDDERRSFRTLTWVRSRSRSRSTFSSRILLRMSTKLDECMQFYFSSIELKNAPKPRWSPLHFRQSSYSHSHFQTPCRTCK